ncbi:MAG: YggS family pyridoxal phosphate-dependent enzyme [Oscillospiraceae bacterium]|jgi:pyridoxal phosphate enzyme (YggS family)
MSITENVKTVQSRVAAAARAAGRDPAEITLVAATKMNDAEKVREAIAAGIRVCGENRVQELREKNEAGAYTGASLHFIGTLQKNKVKYLVGVCDLIESVSSVELLECISERAQKRGLVQDVLLEINIAGEASKSGLDPSLLPAVLEKAGALSGIRVRGLMAIPPIAVEKGENRAWFARMHQLFVDNSAKKYDNISMDFLSMGMSGDFEDAIAEGANIVRVGTAIFGARPYPPKEN